MKNSHIFFYKQSSIIIKKVQHNRKLFKGTIIVYNKGINLGGFGWL